MSIRFIDHEGENIWVVWDDDWKNLECPESLDDRYVLTTCGPMGSIDGVDRAEETVYHIYKSDVDRVVIAPPQ